MQLIRNIGSWVGGPLIAGVGFLLTLNANGPAWVAPLAYTLIVLGCLGTLAEIVYAFVLASRRQTGGKTDTSSEALADRGAVAVAGVTGDVHINHNYRVDPPSLRVTNKKHASKTTEWRQQGARFAQADQLEVLLNEGMALKKAHASSKAFEDWRERVILALPMGKRAEFRNQPTGGHSFGTVGGPMAKTHIEWDLSLGCIETTIGELRGD